MQSLLNFSQSVTSLSYSIRQLNLCLSRHSKRNARLQRFRIPADEERREKCLIEPRGDSKKINYGDPIFHCLFKPTIVGRIRVLPHERVVNGLVATVNLLVDLGLVVIPDSGV